MKNKSYKHWLIVVLMCGLAGSSIGICSNTVGVFYTPVSESLGVLRGTFAFHSTLSLIATGCTALLLPGLMKKYPYKRILITGSLLAAASTVAMAFSRSVMLFNLLGILRGIGNGAFAGVPITMTINNWFKKSHGMATSLSLSFSGVAGAVFTPVLTGFIAAHGWQAAYILQAGLIFALTLPAILYPYTLDPADMGLEPYGAEPEETEALQASTGSAGAAGSAGASAAAKEPQKKFQYFTMGFLSMCCFAVLVSSITGVGQHMNGFAQSVGFPAAVGAAMVSSAMVGNIGSKIIIGLLSDLLNPLKACCIMLLANVAALLIIFAGGLSTQSFLLLAGALIYGSVYSVGAVGVPLLVKYFFGAENYGAAYSRIGLLTNVGASLSLTLIGYVYDFTGSYNYALLGAAALQLLNLLLLMITARATGKR